MPDILALSDEDFLEKMGSGETFEEPASTVAAVAAVETPTPVVETPAAAVVETPVVVEKTAEKVAEKATEAAAVVPVVVTPEKTAEVVPVETEIEKAARQIEEESKAARDNKTGKFVKKDAAAPAIAAPVAVDKTEKTDTKVTDPAAAAAAPLDYKALYEGLMAPLAANGTKIDLRNPEEVRQLMQMGANYTKKMQGIAPHRKVLTMLEANGLLDEGRISFAIDLMKKDPAAITKLIKDSGIDPLNIDLEAGPRYVEGAHRVSDNQAEFQAALTDMKSTAPGLETLREIDSNWDNASKDFLLREPTALASIHEQRESGVYAKIAVEVSRQRTLGQIAADVPFLQAYKTVGDQMVKALPASVPAVTKAEPVAPVAIETKVETPASKLANGKAAAAASPTRATPAAVKAPFNPLAMSDADFLKLPQLRTM